MQTTFQYQQKINNEKSVKYVLPGTLQNTYKKYDPSMENILRDTEKCPFTSIRQLIIAFKRTDPYSTDVNLSNLLTQKYRARPQLQRIDQQLNTCISQAQQQQIRFNKLSNCANYYNNLLTRNEQSQLRSRQLNQNKVQQNDQLLRMQKQNQLLLQKQNKYFQCIAYSQQLERALTLGSLTQSQKLGTSQNISSVNINNYQQFTKILLSLNEKLKNNLDNLKQQLFYWRQKSKHGFITNQNFNQPNQAIKQWKSLLNQINQTYLYMGNFSSWMELNRNQLRRMNQNNKRQYQSFLPKYIKAKEISQISSQKSAYRDIIRGQKKKLQLHLRAQYGMIVPYTVTDEYAKMITPLQNPQNQELKNLVADELIPLQQGLNYVNGDYEKLYRDACDDINGKQRVKRRVEDCLNKFTAYSQNPNQDNSFFIHLIQSCRKLLRITR